MIWFGNLALVTLVAGPVPDGLAARVRASIAREWQRDPSVVRVQWGIMPIRAALADDMAFRLVGRGQDGRYVVLVSTPRGELAVSVRAGVEDSVWVSSRPVPASVTLAADDVKREVRMVWGASSATAKPAPLGWETQRSLGAGQLLVPPAIREPAQVEPGRVVRFEWSQGEIAIVREALAANRARLGEIVWATDRATGQRISGRVIGPARARLTIGGT
jgi:flagella basal body P-ring formation protein FlgA